MSDNAGAKPGPEPSDRVAIGITFGNSNSSIAFTVDDKAEVIANEDGGMSWSLLNCILYCALETSS
jgi:molecular chaperone DnaK (HSP70)